MRVTHAWNPLTSFDRRNKHLLCLIYVIDLDLVCAVASLPIVQARGSIAASLEAWYIIETFKASAKVCRVSLFNQLGLLIEEVILKSVVASGTSTV